MTLGDTLSTGEKRKITRLRHDLLDWYALNGRYFPWRAASATTFERICVEVLLQRTRAETVAAMYRDFFNRFGSWTDLASATIGELEDHLRPIGLWKRRAVSIKGLAEYAASRDGAFPSDVEELKTVSAVGQYVQNAILLFQHGEARPLLDVNMARVIERYIRPRRLADIRYDPWLQAAAKWLVQGNRPVETNWASLDFGSMVCVARTPRCGLCPIYARCMRPVAPS